tara:strand:+ start:150 stop:713 length:564 start_codon:yes stop_codon:yes gene_type:complete
MLFPKRNKITETKIKLDKKYKYTDADRVKPVGFWYGCGSEWYDIGVNYKTHKYLYSVKLKRSILTKDLSEVKKGKVLQITKKDEMRAFDQKYGKNFISKNRNLNNNNFRLINWKNVYKDFAGLEICPYQKKSKYGLNGETVDTEIIFWYSGWDVASACIWDLNAIDNIELKHTLTKEEINQERKYKL